MPAQGKGYARRLRPWAAHGVAALLFVLWANTFWFIYATFGLFNWLGIDYAHYFAQAAALWAGDPIYDTRALEPYHRSLSVHSRGHWIPAGPVPYPALFAWLFTPFTLPPPPIGFALWTAVNFLGALYLAWRVAGIFPSPQRLPAAMLVLTLFPVPYVLLVGQPTILQACAIAECYLSLRAGRDFRAGLWLSALVLKPHYGLLLGLLLLWKRRWAAVAGAASGVAVVVVGSAAVAGIPGLLTYPAVFADLQDFLGTGTMSFAPNMVNWRALVLWALPAIPSDRGIQLVLLLGVVTVGLAAAAWRGPWAPHDRSFPARMLILLLATLVTAYHSHLQGVVLITLPAAALLAQGQVRPLTLLALIATAVMPTLVFTLTHDPRETGRLLAVLFLLCLGSLLVDVRWPRKGHDLGAGGIGA